MHTVDLEVRNLSSTVGAGPFDVEVRTDNGLSVVVSVPGLAALGVMPLSVTLGPGNNCFNSDCQVTAIADVNNAVAESDETNNTDQRLEIG